MRGRQKLDRPYRIEGSVLESCSCRAPCPCWIGADPDSQPCRGFNAYHIERGAIGGVDVGGCDFIRVFDIPGNILVPSSWRQVFVIDRRASGEQAGSIVAAYTGAYGGPLADLARLVGETRGVERAEIGYGVAHGDGTLRAGGIIEVAVTPYRGADGTPTTLQDSLMSGAPRAPAYVAQAQHHDVSLAAHGMAWTLHGRSALQSAYEVHHEC